MTEFQFIAIAIGALVTIKILQGYYVRRYVRREKVVQQSPGAWQMERSFSIAGMAICILWRVLQPEPWAPRMVTPLPLAMTGVLLSFTSVVLFVWVHRTLGANWSGAVRIREHHELIARGPYRFVRHPMYTSLFLLFISFVLMRPVWPMAAAIVWITLFYVHKALTEERLLIRHFGRQYEQYIRFTGRFFPKLS